MERVMDQLTEDATVEDLTLSLAKCNYKDGDFKTLVRRLLSKEVDVNCKLENNQTPLHFAAKKNDWQLAIYLIKNGADINALDDDLNTALHLTIPSRRNLTYILLKYGASVHLRNIHGRTPLHIAALNQFSNDVRLLLEYSNPDVNAVDDCLETPLHLVAKSSCNVKSLKLLLKHGSNVNMQNYRSFSALSLAIPKERRVNKYGAPEADSFIMKLLRKGASPVINDQIYQSPMWTAIKENKLWVVRACLRTPFYFNENMNVIIRICFIHKKERIADCLIDSFEDVRPLTRFHRESRRFAQFLRRHRVRTTIAESGLSEASDDVALTMYERVCMLEIRTMKSRQLTKNLTVYDFLIASRRKLVNYAKRKEVRRFFLRNDHWCSFKIYGDMLERNWKIANIYEQLFGTAENALCLMFLHQLPQPPLEKIIDYLSASDLKNVIAAASMALRGPRLSLGWQCW